MQVVRTASSPSAAEVRAAREAAGLTQTEACELTHLGSDTRWSEYEHGARTIDPARFELFLIKTGQHPQFTRRRPAGRKPGQRERERDLAAA